MQYVMVTVRPQQREVVEEGGSAVSADAVDRVQRPHLGLHVAMAFADGAAWLRMQKAEPFFTMRAEREGRRKHLAQLTRDIEKDHKRSGDDLQPQFANAFRSLAYRDRAGVQDCNDSGSFTLDHASATVDIGAEDRHQLGESPASEDVDQRRACDGVFARDAIRERFRPVARHAQDGSRTCRRDVLDSLSAL
ncbi:hypothetical protein ASE61_19525 [Bosea sp. Root670]|nr:hypothetical protein ASE61_19525 [Bosea sp. Root670]